MNDTERNAEGQFITGNQASSLARRRDKALFMKATTRAVSPRAWRRIVRKAVENAENGDSRAREWLSQYIIGKPMSSLNLSADELRAVSQLAQVLQKQNLSFAMLLDSVGIFLEMYEQPKELESE